VEVMTMTKTLASYSTAQSEKCFMIQVPKQKFFTSSSILSNKIKTSYNLKELIALRVKTSKGHVGFEALMLKKFRRKF
jgi:hypothetical protein